MWGKPLQSIAADLPIVEHLARSLQSCACVAEVGLAIADGPGDGAIVELAKRAGLRFLVGSETDVLGRVIDCARELEATDVLRKTSEDPFFSAEMLDGAWEKHQLQDNDVTAFDNLPEGTAFEIFTVEALTRCHRLGDEKDREHIADYARFNQAAFRVNILLPDVALQRIELRLTVDNPEDLILCREVFHGVCRPGTPASLHEVIGFLDDRPTLKASVQRFVDDRPVWLEVPQRDHA